ncbi:MAG: DUF924 family protein [Hyphomicrobiales bacterium]|nr:DUF924 family protein [Hyphomicrobiales bacterium]
MTLASAEDVVAFWWDIGPRRWFGKDDALDAEIGRRFLATYEAAAAGRLSHWEATPSGALALMLLLDQFPRNMFRGNARAFATDADARAIADRAIARGHDRAVAADARMFFYLPFEHSEAVEDQERSCALFRALGDAEALRWAELHADIIRRFGRFPHRNVALGRDTSEAERAFLAAGGFAG